MIKRQILASYILRHIALEAVPKLQPAPSTEFESGKAITPHSVVKYIESLGDDVSLPNTKELLDEFSTLEKAGYCKQTGKTKGSLTQFVLAEEKK